MELLNLANGTRHDQAIASGMTTLQQDGVNKLIQGVTTVEEVLRITAKEAVA